MARTGSGKEVRDVNIGEQQEEWILVPEEEPLSLPVPEESPEPETVPATPSR